MSAEEPQATYLPMVLQHYGMLPQTPEDPPKSTYDMTTREGRVAVQRVLAGESIKLWDEKSGLALSIRHIITHYGESEDDETGETRGNKIITLVCDEGVYYTMSMYAYRDLQRAAFAAGWRPGEEALNVVANHTRCANGHTRLALVLAE